MILCCSLYSEEIERNECDVLLRKNEQKLCLSLKSSTQIRLWKKANKRQGSVQCRWNGKAMMPDLHPGNGKPSPFFIEREDMKQKRQAS